MKTTPKPRATKNRSGELVGPPLLPLEPCDVAVGMADVVDDGDDMVALVDPYSVYASGREVLKTGSIVPTPSETQNALNMWVVPASMQAFRISLLLSPAVRHVTARMR